MTSATAVTASTPLSLSGTLGVVQSTIAGVAISTGSIDLSSVTTVGALMGALNGISGISAGIVDGRLTISSTAGGVSLDSTAALTDSNTTLSDWMGFNNVFSGNNASSIRLSDSLATDPGSLAVSSLDTAATVGQIAVASGGTGHAGGPER